MGVTPTGPYSDVWFPPQPGGYEQFSWTVTVLVDPTPDGVFWAHQFWIVDAGVGGYVGLQTVGSGIGGRTAIFSIWNALECWPGSGRFGRTIAQPFTGEGNGQQTLIAYPWEVGRVHTLDLRRVAPSTWGATVDATPIGTIHVPAHWRGLDHGSICWTERYAGRNRRCSDLRYAAARFGEFRAGAAVAPERFHHHLSEPPGDCPSRIDEVGNGAFEQHFAVTENG